MSAVRWVLAYDASCARCREVSTVVEQVCANKLEVLPLASDEVRAWHHVALGDDAPWVPTLFAVGGDEARAWTGVAMGARLVRRIGVRSAIQLVKAFRRLPAGETPAGAMGRKSFLRFGAGLGVAAGLILTGRTAAVADSGECAEAAAWVRANLANLPRTYEEFVTYSPAYRRAIYGVLPWKARGQLWGQHFAHYRATHSDLTPNQLRIIEQLELLVRDPSAFSPSAVGNARHTRLESAVRASFSKEEGAALVATLGPAAPRSQPRTQADAASELDRPNCECSVISDWCWGSSFCYTPAICNRLPDGCGWLHNYACVGLCCSC